MSCEQRDIAGKPEIRERDPQMQVIEETGQIMRAWEDNVIAEMSKKDENVRKKSETPKKADPKILAKRNKSAVANLQKKI